MVISWPQITQRWREPLLWRLAALHRRRLRSNLLGRSAFVAFVGNGRNRRNGDPERAAPKVRFRHDRRHSHSAGDLPGDPFHDFPGWVRPAFSKGTYLTGFYS